MPVAQYQIGPAQRPYLPHDRGFVDCQVVCECLQDAVQYTLCANVY
jgi:hypothetical protein